MVLLALNVISAFAETTIYTAVVAENQTPSHDKKDSFNCTENIHAVVEFQDISVGQHELRVRWFAPSGKKREDTSHKFWAAQETERVWSWLKLHRETGAGLLRWVVPSAGMDEFIGEWKVSLDLDGVYLGESRFNVLC